MQIIYSLLKRYRNVKVRIPAAVFRRSNSALNVTRFVIARRRYIIVLGGHNGDSFDDNSRAMAVHLAKDDGYKVFWVSKKTHRRDIGKHNITQLRKGTFRAELVVAAANCLYYSHGLSDVTLAPVYKTPWRVIVYLGHGVWGFKRVERRGGSEKRRYFDATICASSTERKLKSKVLRLSEKKILQVGLPKHDSLIAATHRRPIQSRGARTVLYAPTWRDWLQHRPSDVALQKHFEGFEKLAQTMPKCTPSGEEISLVYLVHKNIRRIAEAARRIARKYQARVLISEEVDVNKLLSDADYFITDYSALYWDFVVQRKPAVRFLFDDFIYESLTGSYSEVSCATDEMSFTEPALVWSFLFSDNAREAVSEIAKRAVPFSRGMSCERMVIEMDRMIKEQRGSK